MYHKKHQNEIGLGPQFKQWCEENGHDIMKDDRIGWDFVIDGKTHEVKFRGSDNSMVLLEYLNCAWRPGCEDCRNMGYNPETDPPVLLGWAHPQGYCKAQYITYVHSVRGKMTRIVSFRKEAFLAWFWNIYLRDTKSVETTPAYYGAHNTLCFKVPLYKIPNDFYVEVHV